MDDFYAQEECAVARLANNLNSSFLALVSRGVHSQEMPGTEVPLGWVAIFELRYRGGSRFLPFGIKMNHNFCHQVYR